MILFILEVVSCYPGRTAATITEGDAFSTGDLHVTDMIMNNSFWLGVYPGMTKEKLQYMADTIKAFVATR